MGSGASRKVPFAKLHEEEQNENVVLLKESHYQRGTLLLTLLSLFELILSSDYNIECPQVWLEVLSL
jgi:hypothetical protein